MSSGSIRYFSVVAANNVAGQPDVRSNFRLNDAVPLNYAFVFIPAGQAIPNAPAGTPVAGPGGAYVINPSFLPPSAIGDLVSVFARGATTGASAPIVIAVAANTASATVAFTNQFNKGLTYDAPSSSYIVPTGRTGYYRVNAGINATAVPLNRDITISVQTATSAAPTVFTTVPQGTFTIIGCPTVETVREDVFTNSLGVGDRIRVLATIGTTAIFPATVGSNRAAGDPAADFQFVVGIGSVVELNYLGTP